jgi:hypothetical protein
MQKGSLSLQLTIFEKLQKFTQHMTYMFKNIFVFYLEMLSVA